jgi:hypothetical protein
MIDREPPGYPTIGGRAAKMAYFTELRPPKGARDAKLGAVGDGGS